MDYSPVMKGCLIGGLLWLAFIQPVQAVGFGNVNVSVPSGSTAAANTGTFSELVTRTYGSGASAKGIFDGFVNSKAVQWEGYRVVDKAAITTAARSAARAMGYAGLAISVGALVYEMWEGSEQWTAPETEHDYTDGCWRYGSLPCYGSPDENCQSGIYVSTVYTEYVGCLFTPPNTSYCSCRWMRPSNGVVVSGAASMLAYSCPGDEVFVGTGCVPLSRHPATDAEMEQVIGSEVNDPDKAKAQAERNRQTGYGPLTTYGPVSSTSGPATGPASTSTKTEPNGTTVTTTKEPSFTYSSTTNNITTNVRTTVTTCVQAGSCTTTTTEETGDTNTDFCQAHPESAACKARWCDEHPESAGCQDLAIPVESVDIPVQEVPLSWVSERSAAGSCPADVTMSLPYGQSMVVSWYLPCMYAEKMRPLLIAFNTLGALIYIVLAIRRAD